MDFTNLIRDYHLNSTLDVHKAVECTGVYTNFVDLGGSIRSVSPEVTLRWLAPKLSTFGITRVADITGLDQIGIPVAIAIRPLARSISVSQGKGISLDVAKVSAIMESIEVWHAEHLRKPMIVSSYDCLRRNHECIPVTELIPKYEPSDQWHATLFESWHCALDVMSSSEVLISEAAISLDTIGRSALSSASTPTTNGLASGNSRVEAICHSAFEIIERHGFTAWYQMSSAKRAETAIDLSAVGGPNELLIKQITNVGLQLNVFDLSQHSLGLPCFVAEISGNGTPYMSRPYTGRGLHVSADIALTRAITESAQSRLSMISGAREDNHDEDYYLWNTPQVAKAALCPTRLQPQRMVAWLDNPIGFLKTLLLEHGFSRWILYDHTRSEFEVPVIHGFIPGMDHIRI